jgi:hypothetical protein
MTWTVRLARRVGQGDLRISEMAAARRPETSCGTRRRSRPCSPIRRSLFNVLAITHHRENRFTVPMKRYGEKSHNAAEVNKA